MVKPSKEQLETLTMLRARVVDEMTTLGDFNLEQIQFLQTLPLGVLKKNATQRHGVTRWLSLIHI